MESRPFTLAFEADPGLLEVRGAIDDTDVPELQAAIDAAHVALCLRHLIIDVTQAERLPGKALEVLGEAQRVAEETWPKVHQTNSGSTFRPASRLMHPPMSAFVPRRAHWTRRTGP